MLRHTFLASVCALALAGTAFAADLPSSAPAPVTPPPPPIWTGFYAGVNAGGSFGGNGAVTTTDYPAYFFGPTWTTEVATSSALANAVLGHNKVGFIGGGQIGYNYQYDASWVIGFETDIQGIAGSNSSASAFGTGIPADYPNETIVSSNVSTQSTQYLGTVRGRLGYLATPTLLAYATGGLAYGGVKSSANINQAILDTYGADPGSYASSGNYSGTRTGWVVGGGLEWMFAPNWSLKAEYLHYDLGRATYALSPLTYYGGFTEALYASAPQASTRFNGNVVRAGISYHFNFDAPAAVVAKY
jgi:outer membrane immunogenic protein